jgi:hypothetical protein
MQLDLLTRAQQPAPPPTVGWTAESKALLVRLYEGSEIPDVAAIARALGKSVSAVSSFASRMGLTSKSCMRRCANAKCARATS